MYRHLPPIIIIYSNMIRHSHKCPKLLCEFISFITYWFIKLVECHQYFVGIAHVPRLRLLSITTYPLLLSTFRRDISCGMLRSFTIYLIFSRLIFIRLTSFSRDISCDDAYPLTPTH
ncbi:hypothetical protein LXL04_016635, partial [Taraxacum kok-saghyz]